MKRKSTRASFETLEARQLMTVVSPVQFGAPTPYVTGNNTAAAVAPGDFNHDGNVDLAIITRQTGSQNTLKWMAGDGHGALAAPKALAALSNPENLAVGDFNGDGLDDLAVSSSNGITLFFNDGTGLVQKATTAVKDGVMSMIAVDANADGKTELAIGRFPTAVSIYSVDSSGNAHEYEGLQSPKFYTSFTTGDLNGDKVTDLIATAEPWNGSVQPGSVDVFWGSKDANGKATGQFAFGPSYAAGTYPTQVVATNLNGAAKDDLVFVNQGDTYYLAPGNISTLLGNSTGTLSTPHQLLVGSRPKMVALGDFGDGKTSNVEADLSKGLMLSTSNGDGTFSAQTTINGTFNAVGVWKVDLNKDGKADVVATDNTGKLFTFLNITSSNTGAISGSVFNDANGNGVKDAGELGLSGRTVFIDVDNDKVLDADERWTTTGADGGYTLSSLAAGTYKVRELLPAGWSQTTPTNGYGINVTLAANQVAGGKLFGTRQVAPAGASISGTVFLDSNLNGMRDAGESGIAGRTLWIDLDNDKVIDANEMTVTSDVSGNFKFTGLAPGTYKVRQVLNGAYAQTTPANGYGINVTVTAGQAVGGKLFGDVPVI